MFGGDSDDTGAVRDPVVRLCGTIDLFLTAVLDGTDSKPVLENAKFEFFRIKHSSNLRVKDYPWYLVRQFSL